MPYRTDRTDDAPDFTAVIVTYNGGDFVERCVRSVLGAAGGKSVEAIVVDNASSDGSAEAAEAVGNVKVLRNKKNLGFAAAANRGAAAGRGRLIVMLNQDTEVRPGAFDAIADFFDAHPEAGVVGPKMIDSTGEIDPSLSYFPTVFNVVVRIFGFIGYLPKKYRFGPHRVPLSEYGTPRRVDWVSGGCFVLRREVFDALGGLDERYLFHGEETDFCFNAKRRGWEVWYTPDAEVDHHGGTAARKVPIWAMEQSYRSMILFFRKNYRWDRSVLLNLFFLVKFLLGFIISCGWAMGSRREEGRARMAAYRRLIRLILG